MRKSKSRFIATLILTSLFSFSANAAVPSTKPSGDDVQQKLRAVTETFRKQSPDAVKTFDADVAIVAASDIAENALKVGDKAEDFELPGANGKGVRLTELLKKGPRCHYMVPRRMVAILQHRPARYGRCRAGNSRTGCYACRDYAGDAGSCG